MNVHPFSDRRRGIQREEPIELYGLCFHPILVEDYETFSACKSALLLRQGTLPAVYAAMNYLACLWAYDYDAHANNQQSGFFARMMGVLRLSLRFSDSDGIAPLLDKNDQRKLIGIRVRKGEVVSDISTKEFREVRQLIAEQNGETLPDESENPELLEALRDRAELNGEKLQVSFDDLLASVAFQSNTTVRELWGWTIKAFEQRRRAIDRHINHLICGIGEMSGNVSWKNGNPYPSWCFDKKVDTRTQFVSEGEMLGQFGKVGSIQ